MDDVMEAVAVQLVEASGGVVQSGLVVAGAGVAVAALIWGSVKLIGLFKVMALERAYERNPD